MVTEFGMSDRLGPVRYAGQHLRYLASPLDSHGDISALAAAV
jgi:ATP-dependent Zn protease